MSDKNYFRERDWLEKQTPLQCFYCGISLHLSNSKPSIFAATIDHYIPKTKKGWNRVSNYRVSCKGCNAEKGSMQPEEYLRQKEGDPRKIKTQ